MIKYLGINALKETLKNKSFFDSIGILVNEANTAVSSLKDIKIQALYSNNKREEAISMLRALLDQKISEVNKLEDLEQHGVAEEQLKDWR